MAVRIVKRPGGWYVENTGTVDFPSDVVVTQCTTTSHTQLERTQHGIVKRIIRDVDDSEV